MWRPIAVLGVVGAACLTRPVVTADPNLKTNFTSSIHSLAVDKLDLLFMIDNSQSMGDKQTLLALAVPDMINRLVSPNCVDATGATIGPSTNAVCATGSLEFPPVHDMHIGIVTSSLGARGAPPPTCDPTLPNSADPTLPSHNDDRGEMVNRGGATEAPVPNAGSPLNFLAWYPPVIANKAPGATAPPVPPETQVGAAGQPGTLIGDFTSMISGVHEHGCGFEAQNEAWYRFLVQPDPFQSIQIAPNSTASLQGVDTVLLQQRKAFLRPDSLLAIIVVTDENEEVANPEAVGGLGYLFEDYPWPNAPSANGGPGGAPEGTIECKTSPIDPKCLSCANPGVQSSAATFTMECPNDPPNGAQGYLDSSDDAVNTRFFNQKQRFGIFAGYPISRYIRGMTRTTVPDRQHEINGTGDYVGDQDQFATCINPIFAADLPDGSDPTKLCALTAGPRTPDLVYYAVIGGVPHQFLQAKPGDPECSTGTNPADCPQKNQLTEADWQSVSGKDPANYDFTGVDFHMLESEVPRVSGSSTGEGTPANVTGCPPTSADNCDPINGREWNTQKQDLQFSCTFPLAQPKDCTLPQYNGACDCGSTTAPNPFSKPLCQKDANGNYTPTQIYGKAYPSVRELAIAHAMADQASGIQGIVSSLCPIHPIQDPANPNDPVYGYRPAVNAIINRLKNSLSVQCLPQRLTRDQTTGVVPCLILVTLTKQGPETDCLNQGAGFSEPTSDVLTRFQAGPHSAWVAAGGATSGSLDPSTFPTCVLQELTPQGSPAADFSNGSCAGSMDPGWCYVEGEAAGTCPQQILFTNGEPPQGASVSLQCIEQANGAVDGG